MSLSTRKAKSGLNIIMICVIAGLIAVSLIAWIYIKGVQYENPTARIYQNNALLYEIDLAEAEEAYEIIITADNGFTNTIEVRRGEIGVKCADCPDKTCVKTGYISQGAIPIICLPNRLEIRVEEKEKRKKSQNYDGVTR